MTSKEVNDKKQLWINFEIQKAMSSPLKTTGRHLKAAFMFILIFILLFWDIKVFAEQKHFVKNSWIFHFPTNTYWRKTVASYFEVYPVYANISWNTRSKIIRNMLGSSKPYRLLPQDFKLQNQPCVFIKLCSKNM